MILNALVMLKSLLFCSEFHLMPFKHDDFELWTKSLQLGLRASYEPADFIIGGGLDDVWHNRETDEIHIVDYKSTAGKRNEEGTALNPISLFGTYKEAYKNQMDMYQWILKQQGFNVSNTGYFVYVNGDQHFQDGMLEMDADAANMKFDVQLIEYEGNSDLVEQSILDLRACLDSSDCQDNADSGFGPKGDKQCEYAELFDQMKDHNLELG